MNKHGLKMMLCLGLVIIALTGCSIMRSDKAEDLKPVPNARYASLKGLAPGSREAQARQKAWVRKLGLPLEVETRKVGIKLRLIPPGTFTMGSSMSERQERVKGGGKMRWYKDETQHSVTLTKSFYCGKYEVTQGQWKRVMGSNPSELNGAGDNAPVEEVSWEDCQKFLTKLCELEGVPQGTYRLLTEAQWEYACRAGTSTSLYNGDLKILGFNNGPKISEIGWYGGNSGVSYSGGYDLSKWKEKQYSHSNAGTHPVGMKKANAFGLYDMIGNVWEWCDDWYGIYSSGSVTDPKGVSLYLSRVYRGGCWVSYARGCSSALRACFQPSVQLSSIGFRIARTTPAKDARFNISSTKPIENKPWTPPKLGMKFVYVAPGSFQMSSIDVDSDEVLVHKETISKGYWIGKYEVTQSEYQAVTGRSPSHFKGANNPVENVSWKDAVKFCQKLTARERAAGRLTSGYEYRLPTEEEWEFAARGGAKSRNYECSGSDNIDNVAWCKDNSEKKTHDVGMKTSNELGIYDMSGNVWELCHDIRGSYSSSQTAPTGASSGLWLCRGGAWNSCARDAVPLAASCSYRPSA
jgi:formylglycine-generating enzyme required for sulfatase activity